MQNSRGLKIEDLKARISIRAVLENFNALDGLRQCGNEWVGRCPLPGHSGNRDNQNAFSIDLETNRWNCLTHCRGGNQFDLFALFKGVDVRGPQNRGNIRGAKLAMLDTFGASPLDEPIRVQQPKPTPIKTARQPQTNRVLSFRLTLDGNVPFLHEKGFSRSTIEAFGAGECSRGMMNGRICVPIHNASGQLVAYAGRSLEESDAFGKWRFPKGFRKASELFNQHRIDLSNGKVDFLVVVEGFWPAMRLHALGIPCVALMGTEMSETQLNRITELTDRVLLFLDNDEAGRRGTEMLKARLVDRMFVGVIGYPDQRSEPELYTDSELEELVLGRSTVGEFQQDSERQVAA